MFTIRNRFFETNSSAVHAIAIPKKSQITIPEEVHIRFAYLDTADIYENMDLISHVVTMFNVNNQDMANYLYSKGVKRVYNSNDELIENNNRSNPKMPMTDDMLDIGTLNENLLDKLLFGSCVTLDISDRNYWYTGDADDMYYEIQEKYPEDQYNVITLYD